MSINTKLDNLIENTAVDAMTIKHPAREYRTLIAALFVTRYALMVFSIAAAYNYTNSLISGMAENITGFWLFFASALVLVLIELISVGAAGYALKYTARKRFLNAIGFYALAVVMLGVSFVLTTEGLAKQQAEKVSQTTEIDSKQADILTQTETEISEQIAGVKASIELIKQNPQGWQGGKREILTAKQMTEISDLNAQIADLTNQRTQARQSIKQETKVLKDQNTRLATSEGDKYYKIGAGLMAGSILVSVLLSVFFYIIFRHREGTKADMEDLKVWTQNMFFNMFSDTMNRQKEMSELIKSETDKQFREFSLVSASEQIAIDTTHEIVNHSDTTQKTTAKATQKGGIGFRSQVTDSKINDSSDVDRNVDRNVDRRGAEFPHSAVHHSDGKRFFNSNDIKICPTCGNDVNKKHWNAIYCCDNCRKEAWEYKNGRKLIFKS